MICLKVKSYNMMFFLFLTWLELAIMWLGQGTTSNCATPCNLIKWSGMKPVSVGIMSWKCSAAT